MVAMLFIVYNTFEFRAGKSEIPPPDIRRISAGYPPDIHRISAGYPPDIRRISAGGRKDLIRVLTNENRALLLANGRRAC